MRILFMGTGDIALPSLQALLGSRHEVCGVVTQPDRPVGRHQAMHAPPPKVMATAAGVPVLQPERVRADEALQAITALEPDLIVVMAYGQILPKALLEIPPVACINVHASLLPRFRGAACVQGPIDAGDAESGVTIMHVTEALDQGDMILRTAVRLAPDETGGRLHDTLAKLAPPALLEVIDQLEEGTAPRVRQDEGLSTYAPKLVREDGGLDWSRPAVELERRIRAYDPWPGTFTMFTDHRGRARRLKVFPMAELINGAGDAGEILKASGAGIVVACGQDALILDEIQPDGGRRVSAGEFLTGHPLTPTDRFFSLENGGKSAHT
jgi:methionyl-tRNA formyltransferase